MSTSIQLYNEAMDMLLETSRTFYIPTSRLPEGLKEAVTSAYLCMRAIDEIEDHPELPAEVKTDLLREVAILLDTEPFDGEKLAALFLPHANLLPPVTLRMSDWAELCPETIQTTVYRSTAVMARGMADWVEKDWRIHTEEDLDDYTFYVAGLVGLLLADIWQWYNGTDTDRDLAVAYGRGLQAVNMLRNTDEDSVRGVDFFPDGWTTTEMFTYARRNLAQADIYTNNLPEGPVLDFCRIPLILAHGTLEALESGEEKLSRAAVMELLKDVT